MQQLRPSWRIATPPTIIDVTLAVSADLPVWPGDPPVALTRVADMVAGDLATVTHISCSAHAGTHLDAPAHFIAGGATVEALDLDILIGPALVVQLPDEVDQVDARVLADLALPSGLMRLLFRTRNSAAWARGDFAFRQNFVAITAEGAEALVAHGVRLVGVDGLSVAPFADTATPHRVLLDAGVVPVEALDLSRVAPGWYWLCCLPLKLVGADGAPVRAVLLGLE